MKFAKSRISGAIVLILSIALILTGVFAAKAPTEGTPFHPAYSAAVNEQAALTTASEAVAAAQDELERTTKRAADAAGAAASALEMAQAALDAETSGSYDSKTDVGKLGQSILEAQSAGADVSAMPVEFSPNPIKVYNPEICEYLGITVPEGYQAIGG